MGVGVAMPSTGWKVSCAVRPITLAASRGSCRPGSSTMIRRSPDRVRVGSATPSASTRRRSTSTARSVDSPSAFTVGESCVSRTIWVPPRRSSPSRAGVVTATYSEPATIARAIRARTSGARDTGGLRRDHGADRRTAVGREVRRGAGLSPERSGSQLREWDGARSGERERGRRAVAARSRRTAAEPAGPTLGSGRAGERVPPARRRQPARRPAPVRALRRPDRRAPRRHALSVRVPRRGTIRAWSRFSRSPAPSGAVPRTVAAGPSDGDGATMACPPGTTNSAASTASAPSRAAGRLRPRTVRGWAVTGCGSPRSTVCHPTGPATGPPRFSRADRRRQAPVLWCGSATGFDSADPRCRR